MELRRTETGFALYKEKEVIGHCTLHLSLIHISEPTRP